MGSISRTAVGVGLCALILGNSLKGQEFSSWSAPVNLGATVNSEYGDFAVAISKDDLSLYFTSPRAGGYGGWDIWVSQRAFADAPWGPPQNLGPTINTPYDEGAPSLSVDGHRMYFASNRPGGFGGNDIYVSRRHNKRDDLGWQPPENVGSGVNTSSNEAGPAVVEDDETGITALYFDSNRPGGFGPFTDDPAHNGNDIYVSVLQSDETFGPPWFVAELSTTFPDRQPVVRRDGLEIFFMSQRPGGFGNADLWTATRLSPLDPWSPPVNLGPLVNSAANDTGPAISFDGTTLYFQSVNRPGGFGAFDLYATTRSKLTGQ